MLALIARVMRQIIALKIMDNLSIDKSEKHKTHDGEQGGAQEGAVRFV